MHRLVLDGSSLGCASLKSKCPTRSSFGPRSVRDCDSDMSGGADTLNEGCRHGHTPRDRVQRVSGRVNGRTASTITHAGIRWERVRK